MVTRVRQAYEEIIQHIEHVIENSDIAQRRKPVILAASKAQGVAAIYEAIDAGIRDFGENKVQEALDKWPEIKENHPHVHLHLIGALQSNKIAEAVTLFDIIQTVDRVKVADGVMREMQRQGRNVPCYIQVNIGDEPQKSGVPVAEASALIGHCRTLGMDIKGLMCVPPVGQHVAPHFALLANIAAAHGISGLSMGMSDDYETAIRMGSTCVRLGRVLFGERM